MNSTNKLTFLSLLFSGLICFGTSILFSSCSDDDDIGFTKAYSATIMMPDAEDKNVNDIIHIHVNFEEEFGNTIENIRVAIQMVNEDIENPAIIYDKPVVSAVNEATGYTEHHDDFLLNVAPNTDWVIKAYIWDGDAAEFDASRGVVSERSFHVHE